MRKVSYFKEWDLALKPIFLLYLNISNKKIFSWNKRKF